MKALFIGTILLVNFSSDRINNGKNIIDKKIPDLIIANEELKHDLQINWQTAYNWTNKEWERYRFRSERYVYYSYETINTIIDDSVLELK